MYETLWNSVTPGHVVFLLDLSGSMENKIDYVIDTVQDSIGNLLIHCQNHERQLAERISVSVYGYNYQIVELWENYGVKQMAKAMREADNLGEKIFDSQKDAKPEWQTRMQLAFERAKQDVEEWIGKQNGRTEIPAPIVINITDGCPYEGKEFDQKQVYADTLKAARDLMNVTTPDGNVRLLNIHYDPKIKDSTLTFPASMPSSNANMQFLYQASSPLTAKMAQSANRMLTQPLGLPEAREGARSMISNVKNPSVVAQFLNWGSSQGIRRVADAN